MKDLAENKIDIIKAIIVAGFAISVFFHYAMANYFGYNFYPFNTFLFLPIDRFNDFFNIYRVNAGLDPYTNPISVYYPFTFIIMAIFNLLNAGYAFILYITIFILFILAYSIANLPIRDRLNKISSVFIFAFMTYPFIFLIDRGNLEGMVFMFLALFIYFYQKKEYLFSIIFLSFATAMKVYPGVFIVLFLVEKRYRDIFLAAFIILLLHFVSGSMLHGGFQNSSYGLNYCLSSFNEWYIYPGDWGLKHNSSVYGLIKLVLIALSSLIPKVFILEKTMPALFRIYPLSAILTFLLLALYLFRKAIPLWQTVTLLTFSTILLPQVSFDYKLILLLIPIFLFINSRQNSTFNTQYAALFGLLLIPKDYVMIIIDKYVSIAVIINPILMFAITYLIIKENSGNDTKRIKT